MVKAASAFTDAGYRVRVVSATLTDTFRAMDVRLAAGRQWQWDPIEWSADREWLTYTYTRIRHQMAQRATAVLGKERVPFAVATAAFHRLHAEVGRRAAQEPADLYYGGGGGAIAAVADAASRNDAVFGVDLEDFHSGQSPASDSRQALVECIERAVLGRAALVTAGSPAIADAYTRKYGVHATAVCNTFPLPAVAPTVERRLPGDPLRLYWFSQTIGPARGLEAVIDAAARSNVRVDVHLRGAADDVFVDGLRDRAARGAPGIGLHVHGVESSCAMVDLCRPYDIGLAAEPGSSLNNALSLSNKALTYPLAGLALAVTDTPGHRPLIDDIGDDLVVYPPDDVDTLARGLRRWSVDPAALEQAKNASWRAALRRWHWEDHDRDTLLGAARAALG
jgi:hypothetical protein